MTQFINWVLVFPNLVIISHIHFEEECRIKWTIETLVFLNLVEIKIRQWRAMCEFEPCRFEKRLALSLIGKIGLDKITINYIWMARFWPIKMVAKSRLRRSKAACKRHETAAASSRIFRLCLRRAERVLILKQAARITIWCRSSQWALSLVAAPFAVCAWQSCDFVATFMRHTRTHTV